jgi:para-aminobenzoate synthetase component 1
LFRVNIAAVTRKIEMTADELVSALLRIAETEPICLLDSCGVGHLGSHLLIAGITPVRTAEISGSGNEALAAFDEIVGGDLAAIFTVSYDLGPKLLGLDRNNGEIASEPDLFISQFDALIAYDYDTRGAWVAGGEQSVEKILEKLERARSDRKENEHEFGNVLVTSNFSRSEYVAAVNEIKELIRSGDTYQTNLTQQLSAVLPIGLTPQRIFGRLRRDHPSPFAAFIQRPGSTVVSVSPERFFRVEDSNRISTSPIKGTRPRGRTAEEDAALREELLNNPKDRAENTMIVDLLRNDLGRVCEYGGVRVESLCELEEHPTLFHLVSTISGALRPKMKASQILKALFPCGSITGAPKISTMRIIDGLEDRRRGLSMGAIGYYVPGGRFVLPKTLDLSVAIRTMVTRGNEAVFNVGGGIVIDSDPEMEYEESLVKARALLNAIGGKLEDAANLSRAYPISLQIDDLK